MGMHPLRSGSVVALVLATLLLTSFTVHAVEVVTDPTLTMDPNGLTPLAGVVEFETDEAVLAQLTITDGNDFWTVSFPDATQQHSLPVLGLKPDRTYTVDIELIPGGPVGSLFATTDPLPADFPTLMTTVSEPTEMEPGYTLIDCLRRGSNDSRPTYTVIVDSAGDVVWYTTLCFLAGRQVVNGNLINRAGFYIQEWDMLGNLKLSVLMDVPGVAPHHDHLRTSMGTYLSLTMETVWVPDFPTSDTDPDAPTELARVQDNPVVEFLPNGTLRREWFLTEMIDPTRIGYGSLIERPPGLDWAHSNAVVYDPRDDSILVSVRHQDAVVKFSRATGDLVWILGPHDNWSPEFQSFLLHPVGTPFRWQYHQHSPMITGDGTLILFDNGNFRASPFDGNPQVPDSENFSRGVEYEIDEEAMEIRQVWEYGEAIEERLYSASFSDADWLGATGNVLMTFGNVSFVDGVSSEDLGLGQAHARIIETSDDTVPVKVFDLTAYDPTGGVTTVYRSERIPSLYPPQFVKSPRGVGNTLRMAKVSGLLELSWTASPVDSGHDAADWYMVYVSNFPTGGFTMSDSTAYTDIEVNSGAESLVFYKVVAANTAGTSGDEPAP